MATSYLLRAARRARQEAELFAEANDVAAAEFLWKEISETEMLLSRATARMRQSLRTHSVSGFGESHDRMNDSGDRLSLLIERLEPDDTDDDDDEAAADESDGADEEWAEFVRAHPFERPTAERKTAAEKVALPRELSDDEIIGALVVANEKWAQYRTAHDHRPTRGVWASAVASVLAGSLEVPARVDVRHGDVVRVGQRLGKLMRAGEIMCVSQPYEARRYVLAEADDAS